MNAGESTDVMIKLEGTDEDEESNKGASASSPKSKQASKNLPQALKFLQRVTWKTVTPNTGVFSGVSEETLGDLSLFSSEIYKEYIICVGGTSLTHGPFKGYRFIPTLHVIDAYTPGCCCSGQWSIAGTWKYREATGDIPRERYGQKTALINNTLFMFGGRVPDTDILLNDLHALDLESMIWTQIKSVDAPAPRIRHSLTYVDGFLYLLGGNGESGSVFVKDSFWRYDIRANSWDVLPHPPTNEGVIAGHTTSALGSRGLVVFGGCSSIFGREPHLFFFDTVSGRWTVIRAQNNELFSAANAPEDHAVASFSMLGGNYFLFHGGISASGIPNQIAILKHQDELFEWYVPTIKDARLFAPPVELAKHNIVFLGGRLLFIGGTTQFARESEELLKTGCCGLGSYKAVLAQTNIPVIELFKKEFANQSCCTIL